MLTPFILLDLPLSAALDTVNLPSDAANAKRMNRGSSKSKAPLTK
ncbi:MAG: YceK/YidQ family lipoprotein [Limisphaerales bacterium]